MNGAGRMCFWVWFLWWGHLRNDPTNYLFGIYHFGAAAALASYVLWSLSIVKGFTWKWLISASSVCYGGKFFCQSQSHHLIIIFWIGILSKEYRLFHILNSTQMNNFRPETMINMMILTFQLLTSYFTVETYPLLNRMAYS